MRVKYFLALMALCLGAVYCHEAAKVYAWSQGSKLVKVNLENDQNWQVSSANSKPYRISQSNDPSPESKARIIENYGKIPLSFEANTGQIDQNVKFFSRGQGYGLYLSPTEAVMVLQHSIGTADEASLSSLRMSLANANPTPKLSGEEKQSSKSSYFVGNDPRQWRTDIANYGKVRYESVYKGIDLVYYGKQRTLEYDFIVQPGADYKKIRMQFKGADKVSIDEGGNLVLHTQNGDVVQHKPIVYQTENTKEGSIAPSGKYILLANNQVSFEIENYDPAKILVIDPLIYSTYLGGNRSDSGGAIAVDSSGNAYITGNTFFTNFPNTSGGYQTVFNGSVVNPTVFVTKMNSTGTALVYSSYLGEGISNGITVDSSGSVYITGWTNANFPTTSGAYQTALGIDSSNSGDAFVAKLDSTGTVLVYSTYIGGSDWDLGRGIAVDSSGNAYITGQTRSTNFPSTTGAFQTTYGGGNSNSGDAFVTKLDPTGTAIVFSTYLGGGRDDAGYGIVVDSSGDAYITGYTGSANFPTTAGAYKSSRAWDNDDAFVAKLNATGASLMYSTYLGGQTSADYGNAIAVDSSGNAYITGTTLSTDFPTTTGAYQTKLNGASDVFVSKLNPAGTALVYSTFIGGSEHDWGDAIAVDLSGHAYIVGTTNYDNFPTTSVAYQAVSGGRGGDVFMTKLNSAGTALAYSTYLGGSGYDNGSGIAVDSAGDIYITGRTASTNFPMASGAFQTHSTYSDNIFVAKLSIAPASTITTVSSSLNPSTTKDVVVFTATVSGNRVMPTGSVSFMEGTITLGVETLSSGMAIFSPSSLHAGSYSITAVYSGDTNYAASNSSPLTQTVNKPANTASKSKMSSPPDGFTLSSTSQKFVWNQAGAEEYHLTIGTSQGAGDIYSQSQGANNFATVENLPSNGATLYVRLFSSIDGAWQSSDYTYKAYTATSPVPTTTSNSGNSENKGNSNSNGNTQNSQNNQTAQSNQNSKTASGSSKTDPGCPGGALYKSSLPNGSTGSMCLSLKKVATPSGNSKLRGIASWKGFATSADSADGSTFTFAWENYESDPDSGVLYENDPAHGALFVLAYAFPSNNCSGGASFFAVVETLNAASMDDLGSSLTFTPLFGQICGTKITALNSYALAKQ